MRFNHRNNSYKLTKIPVEIHIIRAVHYTYLAADSLKEVDNAGLISPDSALDYVACQTPPGLPNHTLTIKTNGLYRLL